ncbi:MAG: PT domain-containing protein [Bacteroidota bacterium]
MNFNEPTNQRTNEPTNQRTNEPTNQRTNEPTLSFLILRCQLYDEPFHMIFQL